MGNRGKGKDGHWAREERGQCEQEEEGEWVCQRGSERLGKRGKWIGWAVRGGEWVGTRGKGREFLLKPIFCYSYLLITG